MRHPLLPMNSFQQKIAKIEADIAAKNIPAAKQSLQELVALKTSRAEEHNRIGILAYRLQQQALAMEHLKKAIAQKKDPAYFNNLALCLMQLGKYQEAHDLLCDALKINPSHAPTYYNLGVVEQNRFDLTKAKSYFLKATQLDAKLLPAWIGLASVCDKNQDDTELAKYCQIIRQQVPHHDEATALLSAFNRRQKKYDEAVTLIDESLKIYPNSYKLYYEKGHALGSLKRFDESYECFVIANKLQDKKLVDANIFLRENSELTNFYTQLKTIHHPAPQKTDLSWPIFIVGSPRSGTTLLAQMLGMHPKLKSAGELEFIKLLYSEANEKLDNPNNVTKILKALWAADSQDLVSSLQEKYKALLKTVTPDGVQVIDKLPSNARRLALIARIAPGAPVIHIIRDGREVAFSAFTQNFMNYLWHSHNLEHALIEWQSTIMLARQGAEATGIPYIEVRYEDLATNPRETLMRLFTFLGLDWDENCLHFHESKTQTFTASYQQVREKLYTSSLHKAKNYPEVYERMTTLAHETLLELGYIL